MQDEQNTAIGENARQLILAVTETLDAIIQTLREGNAAPRQLLERGEQVWAALDRFPIEDSGTT